MPRSLLLAAIAVLLTAVSTSQLHAASEDDVAYRLNSNHTGQITMPDFVTPVSTKWDVSLGTPIVEPIIAGGTVYAVLNTATGNFNQTSDVLYAFNAKNGSTLWGPVSLPMYYVGGICYDNGSVFVTGTSNNVGSMLVAYSATTGSIQWSASLNTNFYYSSPNAPTPYNGDIIVSGSNVVAVQESNGKTVWSAATNQSSGGVLAVSSAGLFVSGSCGSIYSMDPATGATLWTQGGGCNYGSAGNFTAYSAGDVFVGNFNAGSNSIEPAVLDAGTGRLLQLMPMPSVPAVDTGLYIQVSATHSIIATKLADGTNAWTAPNAIDLPVTPPTIVNGIAYVMTSTGLLNGYDEASGTLKNSIPLGEIPGQQMYNPPQPDLVAGDGIIVASVGTHLVAVGTPFATVTASLSPSTPNGNNNWYTKPVTVTLSTTAGTCYYSLDGADQQTYSAPFTVSTQGIHILKYWAGDATGDVTAQQTIGFSIDTQAPSTVAAVTGTTLVSGDLAGTATVSLVADDNLSGVASTSYSVDGASNVTYSQAFKVTGTGDHTITYYSTDKAGNIETAKTLKITLQPAVMNAFASGIQMISAPAEFSGSPLSSIFDASVSLIAWNPATFSYVPSPAAPADTIHPGVGYWTHVPATGADLFDTGVHTDTTQPFPISLKTGWNLIGNPFPFPVALQALSAVSASGSSFTVGGAGSIVGPDLYTYPAGASAYNTVTGSGSIMPYAGYWVYAYQPCTLIFPGTPNPPGGPSGLTRRH